MDADYHDRGPLLSPRHWSTVVSVVLCVWLGLGLGLARAADLKEGVDQLAVLLGKSVGEGRIMRIAVTDFPDLQGVNSDLSRYIAERLTTRLSGQSQKFRVVERRRLGLVLNELKFSLSDLVNPDKAKQLGKMLGVEGLVVGSVSDLGNQVDIDARIIEIESNNVLPGVSTTLSKDQVVTQLLSQGRQTALPTSPSPGGSPSSSPGSTVTAVPQRVGVRPVNETFVGGAFSPQVVLYNIEIAEGRFLKFNFGIEWRYNIRESLEVYLDNPQESAFLVDQLGRQHNLVQASGISSSQAMRLSAGSSSRFALTFPLAGDVESFRYNATLFTRFGSQQSRIQIRAQKPISVADFR